MSEPAITVYGCDPAEAALFRSTAARFAVRVRITTQALTEATADLARGCRCVSVGHRTRVSDAALTALRRVGVQYVSTRSIGCDHLDVGHAAGLGLEVATVAYSPDSVADFTLMLMLMVVRRARSLVRRVDRQDYRADETRGRELRDLTVGVVGTGRIGTAVIRRLHGFGSRVLTHDVRPRPRPGPAPPGEPVPLAELVRRSDIVTLHTPLTPATHHLLDRRRIETMKPGAIVVNTGRGALLDTAALLAALESGRLGGAGLDVVEGDDGIFYADHRDRPLENKTLLRLQALECVLISPHTAYYTDHALADTVENSFLNCLNFESGNQHG
jgi:D-specific alpha-keto acid dehydrogenase